MHADPPSLDMPAKAFLAFCLKVHNRFFSRHKRFIRQVNAVSVHDHHGNEKVRDLTLEIISHITSHDFKHTSEHLHSKKDQVARHLRYAWRAKVEALFDWAIQNIPKLYAAKCDALGDHSGIDRLFKSMCKPNYADEAWHQDLRASFEAGLSRI